MGKTDDAESFYRLGLQAARRGELKRATTLLGKAAEREPRNPRSYLALGQVLQLQGMEALGPFQWALALDPDCVEAHWGMAQECVRTGNNREALEWIHRHVETRVRRGDRAPRPAPQQRSHVPATTLVCVDCKYYELAAEALKRTLEQCSFERAIFFSDADMRVDGVELVRIPPVRSRADYSRFMMKELDRHVLNDFALVIQWDGYVLSGQRWSAEFQQFDYVGAPWAGPQGPMVGNGGFSLRSKRLLHALQDPAIDRLDPEDLAICQVYRSLLQERHGIRFATPEIAGRFSFETLTPPEPTFGFHGLVHLPQILNMTDAQLAEYRPAPAQILIT
jgi:hypothetical protein